MIPEEFKSRKDTVTFEFSGPADSHGKRPFTMYWWMQGFHAGPSWRGQGFRAVPDEYIKRWKEQGRKVRLVEVGR